MVRNVAAKFHDISGWGGCFGGIFAINSKILANPEIYNPKRHFEDFLWVNEPNGHFERMIRQM